ncbi:hypothetical protein [Bradyrhizobium sp. RDM4]|uniref:hypothetical protein n=1 Tax=Bradyrhizobium sp. RDM4 TaxID=3378765 RepID=UPI0038FD0FB2
MDLIGSTLIGLELVAGGFALSEFAARGINIDMAPISTAADIDYDVNGNLVNWTEALPQFQKYEFALSCEDVESPGFAEVSSARGAIWPGATFLLTTPPELGASEPQTFTVMLLSPGWKISRDEWGGVTGWSAQFREV